MPASSLFKFMQRYRSIPGVGALSWGRADIDGAPIAGHVPTMSEDEMEERLARVGQPQVRTFDLCNPEDTKAYHDVLDMICNKWAELIFRKHLKRVVKRVDKANGEIVIEEYPKVYVEWCIYVMMDGKPMHSQRPYTGRPNE